VPLAVVVAAAVIAGSVGLAALTRGLVIAVRSASQATALDTRPARVVFNDDFSTDRGWVTGTFEGLHVTLGTSTLTLDERRAGETYYNSVPIVGSFPGMRIMMDVTKNTATGAAGVACQDSTVGGYAFWVTSTRVLLERYVPTATTSTLLPGGSLSRRWAAGQRIVLTAICRSSADRVDLELLIDNQALLHATDRTYPGRTTPKVEIQGVMSMDVHRFTVSALS